MTRADEVVPPSFEQILERRAAITPEQRAAEQAERAAQWAAEDSAADYQARLAAYRRISDIGPRFASRTFATFKPIPEMAAALAAAYEAVEDARAGLWLYGGAGVGKTHLAAAIAIAVNERAQAGRHAVFASALSLLDRLRDSYTRGGNVREGEIDVIARYASAPVLVLDDIDKARFSEWASERFYAIINRRYEACLPLIVTSNASPAELGIRWTQSGLDQFVGSAIVDRLREMCGTIIGISAEVESYRGRAR